MKNLDSALKRIIQELEVLKRLQLRGVDYIWASQHVVETAVLRLFSSEDMFSIQRATVAEIDYLFIRRGNSLFIYYDSNLKLMCIAEMGSVNAHIQFFQEE